MSAVLPFTYEGREVRTVVIDGEPWFVAADVCGVLGIGNPSQAVSYLDDDERTLISNEGVSGAPQVGVVAESGLYSLILRSRKPEAKAFKRWITHEVLPAIRKTGGYGAATAPIHPDMVTRADLARMALEAEEEKTVLAAALQSAEPAIAYHERYVADDDVATVKAWAAQFGLTEPQARKLLLDKKIIYKEPKGRRWSGTRQRLEEVYEYRAYRDYLPWFDLRPQHDAPRLHNGQVRQTLCVRQEHALALGRKAGLNAPASHAALPAAAGAA